MIQNVFLIWNSLFLLGFLLIFFRTDANLVLNDILGIFITVNIIYFILSFILVYVFMPLTIPYSIKNILTKK
jgi:hypothetical protein